MGRGEDLEDHSPLAVDSSLELYGILLMMVICVVALWEGGRHCYRRAEAEKRLSKKEMRRLNQLLQRDPDDLSSDDKEVLFALAERAGVDLKKILTREPSMGSATAAAVRGEIPPPSQPPSEAACAADEDFLRRRRRERSMLAARPDPPRPKLIHEYYEAPEPVRLASEVLTGNYGRTRDVGVQAELLQEMPRVVFSTPSGTCIHVTRDCSTLNRSTKYIQKEVCARCILGQRETVERPR